VKIWVDADACPKPVKDILFRAATRTRTALTLVANHSLSTPPSPYIDTILVPGGFDAADNKIAQAMQPGDLVITADIPLAADVIKNGGHALNPRGEMYTTDTIRQRLSMRNFMEELRSTGVNTGGPAALGQADRMAFANALDRFLAQHG
jgi:hypothetical protein